jgi:ornithine cyclodeaminase
VITIFPGDDATPYDSHIGVVLLFDAALGRLLAIADASSVTAIRTAAISGLATRLLAREDATSVTLTGARAPVTPCHAAACHATSRRLQ